MECFLFFAFCGWEMKYDVFHSFGPLASFQNVKHIYRVVLVLLRCRLRVTQNSISVQVALRFVTKLMVPKHETSPVSWLRHTYSHLKISLPLTTIIHPISAFSTLRLPHNYSIFSPTIW